MPLVTRQSNQGNLFKEATTPNWDDGDVWSDTTADLLKINVGGIAQAVGKTDAEIITLIGNNETTVLLDSHVATGTESTYTYTPSSALLPADYSRFIIIMRGQMTLAFSLKMLLNGIASTYQTNSWRNANATTDTNDKVVNGLEYKIHDSSLGGTNADFEAVIEIILNDIASNRPSIRSWCNDNTDLSNTRTWGTISGTAVTTLTSVNFSTSTSTWKAGTKIHTYGVKT